MKTLKSVFYMIFGLSKQTLGIIIDKILTIQTLRNFAERFKPKSITFTARKTRIQRMVLKEICRKKSKLHFII